MTSGTNQVPRESWKATRTVPVSGSISSSVAARPSSRAWRTASTWRLKTLPACVVRRIRPERMQQRRADVPLEPLQTARHAGLAHLIQLGDLGDGRAVRDLLEEAKDLGVHNV